ncbi:MAG: hypothetical protein CK431_07045 [Mycobacterium sp.]|nr:MAG: hypothetical protein CK431_07045 [Mycobacterium sp.]
MIIDRDEAWRANSEWAPIIDAEIRKGIENIDAHAFAHIHAYLWYGGLPGSYETYGFDEKQMAKAWRKYLKTHNVQPSIT